MFSSDETYTFEFVAKNLWMVNITEMQKQYAKVLKTLEAYQDTENKIMREVFVKTMTI